MHSSVYDHFKCLSELAIKLSETSDYFFVCYQLSRSGWNVMPTARNGRGIDVVIYSQDAMRKLTIQVITLSKRPAVPLGKSLDGIFGDFFVICANAAVAPDCYILTPSEVHEAAHCNGNGKNKSYWLEAREYHKDEYRNNWLRIGKGSAESELHPVK